VARAVARIATHREGLGAALLACALVFNAICLAPELHIGGLAWSDTTFHIAASERLIESLARGEPFLDPWVSEWSLGYPVWRSYQPIPHLVAGAVFWLSGSITDHATAFAALQYVLLVLLPLSTYMGARLLRLGPIGAGLAALLIFAPSGAGDLGRYGVGYGAFVWRGSGLYTQLFALHTLVLSLGVVSRALDSGRWRACASVVLAVTALSHVVFGYVALVSAALCAVVGPRDERARRLIRLATIVAPAMLLLAWFVVPLGLTAGEVNHSRFEPAYKWDSYGAGFILSQLCSGELLDGGRLPLLTLLFATGATVAVLSYRQVAAGRLLALTITWLVLFFGRTTWGQLLVLAGIPADLHLHRLQGAFELSAVLLTAWGIASMFRAVAAHSRLATAVVTATIAGVLVFLGVDRAQYLQENGQLGRLSVAAYERERADVESALAAARTILAERPGRVSAGKRATWGDQFRVGDLPMYVFTTLAHLDSVSFLYHSMSLTSDLMTLRAEDDAAHDAAFGVRALIAPVDRPVPPHLRLRASYGRFAVYECSTEGYFGLVDIGARYTGPPSTLYEPSAAWLQSAWLRQGIVVALSGGAPDVPDLPRWALFPATAPALLTPRGQVTDESKNGETYRARIHTQRACYAFVKITWHPDLVATVDGQRTPLLRVTPGFAAVPLTAGDHTVEVRYAPGPLKPILCIAGILLFILVSVVLRSSAAAAAESAIAERLGRIGQRFNTAGAATALASLVLTVLALRPLLRGQLISGHDATAYPPRLVEFSRAVLDGHIPPFWAADFGAGHGQPLFGFNPPLSLIAPFLLRLMGFHLADSLQLGLFSLVGLSTLAVYRLAREIPVSRHAAVGAVAFWLFSPYLQTDLFVRGAWAEAAALAASPLALLALSRLLGKAPSATSFAAAAIAIAAVILGHNAVAVLFIPAVCLVIVAATAGRPFAAGPALRAGGALVFALALSAFFWVPAFAENMWVKTSLLRTDPTQHWWLHFPTFLQLVYSPWGFGLSRPGPNDGMSFMVGPLQLLAGCVGLWAAVKKGPGPIRRLAIGAAAASALGLFLSSPVSAFVWERVPPLQYFVFPWRALGLPTIFLPILAAIALGSMSFRPVLAAIGLVVVLNLSHAEPERYLTFDEEFYEPQNIAATGLFASTFDGFEPQWVEQRPPYTPVPLSAPAGIELIERSEKTARRDYVVRLAQEARVEAATFWYPGWRVEIDGQIVPTTIVPVRGTMSFGVPQGVHRVSLIFGRTPLRTAALLVSLLSAAILLVAIVLSRARMRKRS
jgi:hypothetical protein